MCSQEEQHLEYPAVTAHILKNTMNFDLILVFVIIHSHDSGVYQLTLLFSSCLAACLHGGCQIVDPEDKGKYFQNYFQHLQSTMHRVSMMYCWWCGQAEIEEEH